MCFSFRLYSENKAKHNENGHENIWRRLKIFILDNGAFILVYFYKKCVSIYTMGSCEKCE